MLERIASNNVISSLQLLHHFSKLCFEQYSQYNQSHTHIRTMFYGTEFHNQQVATITNKKATKNKTRKCGDCDALQLEAIRRRASRVPL